MVVTFTLLCFVAFLTIGTEGKTFRSPCGSSYLFRCDNGICINKHQWCDGSRHCSDGSDEKYCQWSSPCEDIHFKCGSGMCIPIQGYCDGYSSCPDQSDEKLCPCEAVNEKEGRFQYEAYIDQYRTQQKCWKISVNEAQYLDLQISATFKNRGCKYGNVSIYPEEDENLESFYYPTSSDYSDEDYLVYQVQSLCPSETSIFPQNMSLTYYKDVYIRYRSNYYYSSANSYKDFLDVTFKKIDRMCDSPKAFKCSKTSCISPEKQCDGKKDCENGKDEINCDYGALSASSLKLSREKATKWMRSQHNADWGWKDNTPRAVIALHLAGYGNFNGTSKDDDLIAKQLELEVFTYLFRHKFDKGSSTVLASYINALLVTCHNPRNFYEHDLITVVKEDFDTDSSFAPPFIYLTLCNAKETFSEDEINNLLEILDASTPNHGFVLELQALTTMTLTCLKNNGVKNLEQNISNALVNLKSMQREDGSFGNEYTTALVLQVLIANNQENVKDWNAKSSIEFLSKRQEPDGSFGDFLTTYLIMPILNAKSLVDIGKVNCTGNKRPRESDAVLDIQSRLGKKIIMKYSLFIGDEKDQIHPLLLRTPENITVLELMTLAANIDPKYKFKIHEIKKKKFIYEISNIPNDPENNRFWFIYYGSRNDTLPMPEQSPDKIKAHEKDHIIMWYKTLDSL